MVEPGKPVVARNLLSKDLCSSALADEPKPRWPEMAGIFDPFAFSGIAERLAGARACPNRSRFGPPCKSEGEAPSADAGEEVALSVSIKFMRLDFRY
jgi:hypothetical protein